MLYARDDDLRNITYRHEKASEWNGVLYSVHFKDPSTSSSTSASKRLLHLIGAWVWFDNLFPCSLGKQINLEVNYALAGKELYPIRYDLTRCDGENEFLCIVRGLTSDGTNHDLVK